MQFNTVLPWPGSVRGRYDPDSQLADRSTVEIAAWLKVLVRDPRLRLNDIWALEKIQGEIITLNDQQARPRLEINLHKMQVTGTDGCNNYSGGIKVLDAERLQFGSMASTRKLCPDMAVANQFNVQMVKAHRYVLEELKLHLFDAQGNELFVFQKID